LDALRAYPSLPPFLPPSLPSSLSLSCGTQDIDRLDKQLADGRTIMRETKAALEQQMESLPRLKKECKELMKVRDHCSSLSSLRPSHYHDRSNNLHLVVFVDHPPSLPPSLPSSASFARDI